MESKEGTDFNTAKGQADDVEGTVDTWRTELQVCVCVCVCVRWTREKSPVLPVDMK